MTNEEINRLNEMKEIERKSGPLVWTVEEMEEYEKLNVRHRMLEIAAPDMFAALKSIIEMLKPFNAYAHGIAESSEKALAAIAKARGE